MEDKRNGKMTPLLWLGGSFGAGGLAGIFLAGAVAGGGATGLTDFLTAYLGALASDEITVTLPALLWSQLQFPLLVLVLSFAALGVVLIPAVFALRGFLLSFSIAAFVRLLGGGGCLLAFVLFGIGGMISVPIFFLLGIQGWQTARHLGDRLRYGKKIPLPFGAALWKRTLLLVGILVVGTLIEFAILPLLLGVMARI